jgi:N-methylhydantoinase B
MANVGLMPVEVAESSYSVRILRTELIPGSQGDGQYRGGLGLRRDYQVLGRDSTVTVYSEQTDPRFVPRGVLGGTNGQPSKITIFDPDGRTVPVGSKATLRVQPGSVIRIETSGGGGYGDPARRDPALRAADEEDGRG